MKRLIVLACALALVAPTAALAAPNPPTEQPPRQPAAPLTDSVGDNLSDGLRAILETAHPSDTIEVIATFVDDASAAGGSATLPPQAISQRFSLISGFVATLRAGQIRGLSHHPGIIRIEENIEVTITNNSANADFGTALGRADFGVDGTGVGICIVDTGIDSGHEQLDDPGKIGGFKDFVNGPVPDPNPDLDDDPAYDDHGHGTHVAATAGGSGTGGASAATFAGVAPGATIYGAKVLSSQGSGTEAQIISGVEWCALQPGVDIISMSLGSSAGSDGLDAMSQAVNKAVMPPPSDPDDPNSPPIHPPKIVVVAAGNAGDGPQTVGSPGAADNAITVGAVAEWSVAPGSAQHSPGIYLAPFSSRGPTLGVPRVKPDVAAPGVSITSAAAGSTSSYSTFSGTSMATPFTAGTVALMLQADPSIDTNQVKALLQSTSQDRGPAGKDNHFGFGLIDGYALVAEAAGAGSYVPTSFPKPTVIPGSVTDGGTTAHTFEIGAGDLGVPIAATILFDGVNVCLIPFIDSCLLWEWQPDLEARIKDPSGEVLAVSECPLTGDCGASGQQETLHVMPTTVGTYTIEMYTANSGGGSYTIYLSTGPVGPPDTTPSAAPAALAATGIGTAIDLSWPGAVDPESAIVRYRIWRGIGTGSSKSLLTELPAGRTTYRDTAVAATTTYEYEVTAVNAVELESLPSPVASDLTGAADSTLLGWWALDDGTGTTATDSSPAGNDGALVDGPVWQPDGEIRGAVTLDGTDDYIHLDDTILDGATDVTTSVWVRTTNTGIQSVISATNAGNTAEYELVFVPGPSNARLRLYTGESNINYVVWEVPTVVDGQWHHIAVTREAAVDEAELFVDGVSQGVMTNIMNPIDVDPNGLLMGQNQDSVGGGFDPTQAFEGDLDEVRLYGRVLSAAEISDLAGLPDTIAPGAPTGLAATPGDGEVSLDWDDNLESDVVGYSVFRSESTGAPYTEVATLIGSSDYVDTSVTNGIEYFYVVAAVDTTGNQSTNSAQVSATPTGPPPPPPPPPPPSGAIDFTGYTIQPYGAGQDAGSFLVSNGGATLELNGNAWKKIAFNYPVTPNTVIEFDFSSTNRGDIHGIGFDTDDLISANRTFTFYGTQNWGISTNPTYPGSGVVTHYVIPVGQFYTGSFGFLTFTNDHDVNTPTAHSRFSNVTIHEDLTPPDTTPPAAPLGLAATPGDSQVVLDWVDSPEPDFGSYRVFRSTVSGGPYALIATGLNSSAHTDTTVTNGTTYFYVVAAVDTTGNQSTNSAQVSATPTGPPPPPPPPPPPSGAIDFTGYTIQPYGAGQDAGSFEVLDGGATLRVFGNAWKKIAFPYTVTSNTVLEFDFSSSVRGDIHGIGFDTDDAISADRTFGLFGTQAWGLRDYATYVSPGVTHYEIPVGAFFTGSFSHLTFVNDHDVVSPNAESVFTNVEVSETPIP